MKINHLLFTCLLATSGYCQSYRTLNYANSPLYIFNGNVLGDETESRALYHLCYRGDSLQSMTYQLNGELKPLYENYTASDFIWASSNQFHHSSNTITVYHFDYLSNAVEGNPAISVYELNSEGKKIGLKYFTAENLPAEFRGIHEYKWHHFENGIGEIRYDSDGNIQKMSSWFPYEWVLMKFDNQKMISLVTTDENWKPEVDAVEIRFEYEDNVTKWIAYEAKTSKKTLRTGPKVAETQHVYDENGYLLMTRFFDEHGKRTSSKWGHMGFLRQYDPLGNRQSYQFIDKYDNPTISDRGYGGQKFIWGKNGLLRTETYYTDADGNRILRKSAGYARLLYLYDFNKKEVGRIYFDEFNNVICNGQVVSRFIFKYNTSESIEINLCK